GRGNDCAAAGDGMVAGTDGRSCAVPDCDKAIGATSTASARKVSLVFIRQCRFSLGVFVTYCASASKLRCTFDNWPIRETGRHGSFICSVAQAFLQLFHRLVDGERRRPLAGGAVFERL